VDKADIARLQAWLADAGIADGPVSHLQPLAGGTQNLLYAFRAGGAELVLRRPSLTPRKGAADTIRREARVLGALAGTDVPHPRFRGLCDDPAVLGATFLVTDKVAGFNAAVEMPAPARDDPAFRNIMGLALVDGIVRLARVDPAAIRLADFGRLDGFIARQASRWAAQLAGYAEHPGWPGPAALGGIESVGAWLDANRPVAWQCGIMHGDYHIANVLFGSDGTLAAILDWELATLGDPLLDLGRLLAAWPDPDGSSPLSLRVDPWHGFPDRDALIARYAGGTGRDLSSLLWYEVLAGYKLAIILEGTHARACAGLADPAVGRRLHASALAMLARARTALERRG
jgi:aminoglycoside phosphotransferase (APT) family kinase protein